MNLKELHEAVSQWGTDRNFFGEGGSTYEGQWCKLFEEAGELATGINKKKDKVVVQVDICELVTVSQDDCSLVV